MALRLVTTQEIESWDDLYQLGEVWRFADEDSRMKAVELVELLWQGYRWKESPFISSLINSAVRPALVLHSRFILENEGQQVTQSPPEIVGELLRPYLGLSMASPSYVADASIVSIGGGGGTGGPGVDQEARDRARANQIDIGTLNSELEQAEENIQTNTQSLLNKANNATVANKLNRNLNNLGTVSDTDATDFRTAIGVGTEDAGGTSYQKVNLLATQVFLQASEDTRNNYVLDDDIVSLVLGLSLIHI